MRILFVARHVVDAVSDMTPWREHVKTKPLGAVTMNLDPPGTDLTLSILKVMRLSLTSFVGFEGIISNISNSRITRPGMLSWRCNTTPPTEVVKVKRLTSGVFTGLTTPT